MSDDDKSNVVKLRQPPVETPAAIAVSPDDPINPKSLLNMTELEQNMFLDQLRERRLKAAKAIKAADEVRRNSKTIATLLRLEKKAEQVARNYERASKALDKLEESIFSLRALTLQHTDVDITDVAALDE